MYIVVLDDLRLVRFCILSSYGVFPYAYFHTSPPRTCSPPLPSPITPTHLQVVHASLQAMVPREVRPGAPELVKPDDEEVEKTTEETRQALEKLVQKKVTSALPVRAADKSGPAQYIRYVYMYMYTCACVWQKYCTCLMTGV